MGKSEMPEKLILWSDFLVLREGLGWAQDGDQ